MQTFEKYLLSVHSVLTLVGTGDTVMNKAQFIVHGAYTGKGVNCTISANADFSPLY